MNDFEDENKQTSESSYILTTVKTPKTTPEGEDALVDEVIEFMKTAEEEDMTSLKPQDKLMAGCHKGKLGVEQSCYHDLSQRHLFSLDTSASSNEGLLNH